MEGSSAKALKATWWSTLMWLSSFLAGAGEGCCAWGAEFRESFDSPQTSWRVQYDKAAVELATHRRSRLGALKEGASENLVFQASGRDQWVQLEHQLPPARVLVDELKLSLWVRATQPGLRMALRVVFPHQQDPRTGEPLSILLPGEAYTDAGGWQQLGCVAREKDLRDQFQLLRFQLRDPNLNFRDLYVDRVVLAAPLAVGRTELSIDELEFGPIVAPPSQVEVELAAASQPSDLPRIEFRLDRLLVDDRPVFPRLAPYHREDLDGLADTGLNMIWVPDANDRPVLVGLQQRGLWAAASPPRAVSSGGRVLDDAEASLMPLKQLHPAILFWYFGTRIPPEARRELLAWCQQVRSADLDRKRPFLADVSGDERIYSRHIPMLGTSRHVLNTSFSLLQYRDYLLGVRKMARPGSFVWTWIQTEPNSAGAAARRAAGHAPIVVEPEQIRLQVYAALSAGCRGIGYWKTSSLDANAPGALERRLAITILNHELELLEPWLASGSVVDHVPVESGDQPGSLASATGRNAGNSAGGIGPGGWLFGRGRRPPKDPDAAQVKLEAAVIRSDRGTLLLPVWYEKNSQFTPGHMATAKGSLVVSGQDESSSAWLITTTDVPRSLPRERVNGGLKITIGKLDQTAAILLTTDHQLRETLSRKVQAMAGTTGRAWVELARTKLHRVRAVNEELNAMDVTQPDAPQLLSRAESFVQAAEEALDRADYDAARREAGNALQALRVLQRAHWEEAVGRFSSPASSPHAVCFQTLPDHWRMIAQIGNSPLENDANLLRSGDFEDIDTMVFENWKHQQTQLEGVRATAELVADAKQGRYSLRLIAVPAPNTDPPTLMRESPVTVTTPPMTVRAGQILHVSGWVRLSAPVVGNLDGAMIYDSESGPGGALRWRKPTGWQRFQMVRQAKESGPWTLTLTLAGLGEVSFDDLRVVPHTPRNEPYAAEDAAEPADGDSLPSGTFDFWDRLPKINPLRRRLAEPAGTE